MTHSRLAFPTVPRSLLPDSAGFPRPLRDLEDPPNSLRVVGSWPLPEGPRVGIVGTRHADPDALDFATDVAAQVAAAGAIVISGGARGIDTCAHRGALSVGAPTVAVLATGLAWAYPPENKQLFEQIAGCGALLSEADDGWSPRAGLFLARNRLIAALSDVLVVVQAPARSGALSTARHALALGRRVLAVPDAPWRPRAAGCLALLDAGCGICTSGRDILSQRPASRRQVSVATAQKGKRVNDYSHLDGLGRRVVELLAAGPLDAEQVGSQLDIPINRVQEVLLTLELAGAVEHRIDGRYAHAQAAQG